MGSGHIFYVFLCQLACKFILGNNLYGLSNDWVLKRNIVFRWQHISGIHLITADAACVILAA